MWSWHDNGWAWIWMTVMMLGFWALVGAAIVVVVRSLPRRPDDGWARPPARTPQDILAERYARGEIDSDEFRRRSRDIASHATD